MKVDCEMEKGGKKIILILDNAGYHKLNEQFKNVKILFLRPNMTADIQPQVRK